ncbi:MAG: ubiquitin-like protein Pup [Actinomycetes bacterium]
MAGQEQKRPTRREGEPDETPPPAPAAPSTQSRDEDVDAILEEIDSTLESNAEEFVRSFVQKGGQ